MSKYFQKLSLRSLGGEYNNCRQQGNDLVWWSWMSSLGFYYLARRLQDTASRCVYPPAKSAIIATLGKSYIFDTF